MPLPPPQPFLKSLGGALLTTLLAGLVYGVLSQSVFYKVDGQFLVLSLDGGRCQHPYNVLYMPLLCRLSGSLRPWGLTSYEISVAFSVIGAALGVGISHIAFGRSGLIGRRLWLATLLVASAAPMMFFATTVEHHAPFMPFAALSFVVTVELSRASTTLAATSLAIGLGLVTHLAYLVHGTGNLLPGVLLPLFLVWRFDAGTRRRDLTVAAIVSAVHIGTFLGLRDIEMPGGGAMAALDSVLGRGIGHPRGIQYAPLVLWDEWVYPYGLLSVAWLAAFARVGHRLEASALALGLIPYLVLCNLLIVGDPEFGAYLLPLAIPSARLAVLAIPRTAVLLVLLACLIQGVVTIRIHDDSSEQDAWATAVRTASGDRKSVLLLGGPKELGFALAALPDVDRYVPVVAVATVSDSQAEIANLLQAFDSYVGMQQMAGKLVLWTAGAEDELQSRPAGQALIAHVHSAHQLTPIQLGSSQAWQIDR